MNKIKQLLSSCMIVLLLLTSVIPIKAQEERVYQSQDESATFSEIVIADDYTLLTMNPNAEAYEYYMIVFANYVNNELYSRLPSEEDPDEKELMIQLNAMNANFYEIVQQINAKQDVYRAIEEVQDLSSGIYLQLVDRGKLQVKITHPKYYETEDVLDIRLYSKDLVQFKKVDQKLVNSFEEAEYELMTEAE